MMGCSVTQRIPLVTQPKGGYLNPNRFEVTRLKSLNFLFQEENIMPTIVGIAVDYLTRFMYFNDKEKAFRISFAGAFMSEKEKEAKSLLDGIVGLDKLSIINACELVCFDGVLRAGTPYRSLSVKPDFKTIANIKEMVTRSLRFFKKYGPVLQDGFTFTGGYTDTVSSGDGDFLTEDTLWDFKVSNNEPTKEHTLQLLMYYIMGKHSIEECFKGIHKIGIFNPRLNKVYQYDVSFLDKKVIEEIEFTVIGYKKT